MRYAYPCNLHPDEPSGFYVTFPDVRGALTSGADEAEALEMAEDALIAILATHVELGEDVPEPSAPAPGQYLVPVPPLVAAKLSLYSAMREQGLSEAALGKRLGVSEEAARKLVNPDYGSHMSQVMRALRAVGRALIVEDAAPVSRCTEESATLARA